MRLKQSSMTTSSSLPRISEIFPAIHLDEEWRVSHVETQLARRRGGCHQHWLDLLLHDLQVDLGHIHFLAELWRELGALEELRIHPGGHDGQIEG